MRNGFDLVFVAQNWEQVGIDSINDVRVGISGIAINSSEVTERSGMEISRLGEIHITEKEVAEDTCPSPAKRARVISPIPCSVPMVWEDDSMRKKSVGNKYHCHICVISFLQPQWLNRHIRKDHQLDLCDDCGEIFSTAHLLCSHIKEKHMTEDRTCLICDKYFESEYLVTCHMNAVHNCEKIKALPS